MADWLSIWNQEKRAEVRSRRPGGDLAAPGELLESIYLPYGKGRIGKGDYIYIIGVERGELLIISRVCADVVAPSAVGIDQVDVTARKGTETEVVLDRFLDPGDTDRLEMLNAKGITRAIKRGTDERVIPMQFMGRASIRELIGPSAAILDEVIGPRL